MIEKPLAYQNDFQNEEDIMPADNSMYATNALPYSITTF